MKLENPPELDWDYPSPFVRTVVPSAGDIDGLNHTNNAVYVRWCDATAWAHSEALGLDLGVWNQLNRAMAIRRSEYDYLLPSFLGEELLLGTWLTGTDGKITMERRFQLVRPRHATTIMRGRWELVCIEMNTGRPRRIPAEFATVYLPAIVDTPPKT